MIKIAMITSLTLSQNRKVGLKKALLAKKGKEIKVISTKKNQKVKK